MNFLNYSAHEHKQGGYTPLACWAWLGAGKRVLFYMGGKYAKRI